MLESEKCPVCGKQFQNPNVQLVKVEPGFKSGTIGVDIIAHCLCGEWYSVWIHGEENGE